MHSIGEVVGSNVYFVYIIQSEKDQSYYVGQTEDVEKRVIRHNAGREKYTGSRIPWKLAHVESFQTRIEAIRREREIKRMKSREYIARLIRGSRGKS